MELATLENWLWRAACSIRGEVDAARYKDFILPLIFYKRLDDVYSDELAKLAEALGMSQQDIETLVAVDRSLIRFYIPEDARWHIVREKAEGLGQLLTDALRTIARENPDLQGVINRRDFNAKDQDRRILDDDVLSRLIGILSESGKRLGLNDVQPDILGRAYEYLIRKFAERGSSAGEFFTPTEVGFLIARILDPQPGEVIYDPAAGSGGLLIKAQLRHREKLAQQLGKLANELNPNDDPNPITLCGQEIQADSVATAKMNAFIHDMDADIQHGNTISNPAFLHPSGGLRQFDKLAANPMWNQTIAPGVYENDTYGRFHWGIPPTGSADWGWVQHMYASLKLGGRMAVVLDTGAASRGSGNKSVSKERDIRKQFVEADTIEAVILLPDNLFFNTSASGIIIVIRKPNGEFPREHADEILLINASKFCVKGRPKNHMLEDQVDHIATLLLNWSEEEYVSKIVKRSEVIRNDYNLSPSRYVVGTDTEGLLSLEEAVVRLREAEEARIEVDKQLDVVMQKLGFQNWRDFGKMLDNDAN